MNQQQQKIDAVRELADRTLSRFLGVTDWVNRPPHNGEDCLTTAIYKESHNHCTTRDLFWVIYFRVGCCDPAQWNDAPGRTFDDVVRLLDSIVDDENLCVPTSHGSTYA
jgi:hypothetical protein